MPKTVNLNPVDNELSQIIAGQNNQINNLGVATQPNFIDWLEFNPGDFSYGGANTQISTSQDFSGKVQPGDRIRWKTGGAFQYSYIVRVSDTDIYITNSNDYNLDNATITQLSVSKSVNPLDFPGSFNYTTNVVGFSSTTLEDGDFTITGNTIRIGFIFQGNSNSTSFQFDSPLKGLFVQDSGAGTGSSVINAADNATSVDDPYAIEVVGDIVLGGRLIGTTWTASGIKTAQGTVDYIFTDAVIP